MKIVIGTMLGFFILSFFVFPLIFSQIFDTDLAILFPLYSGMILLSGLIVACTKIILEEIGQLKEKQNGKNIEN